MNFLAAMMKHCLKLNFLANRGSLRISDPSFGTVIGLLAHVSTLASPKVLEETRFFPDVLCPDLRPRTAVWPKSFMKCGPNMDSIALYFFPDSER